MSQIDQLNILLADSVENGASVGFLSPLSKEDASYYWESISNSLETGHILFIAEDKGRIVGSVQLSPCVKENGRHRAEVQKLFVLSSERGKGIASQLMDCIEKYASINELKLLVLDTQEGSKAEKVYSHLGWKKAGCIPDYAATPGGELHGTVLFYKRL